MIAHPNARYGGPPSNDGNAVSSPPSEEPTQIMGNHKAPAASAATSRPLKVIRRLRWTKSGFQALEEILHPTEPRALPRRMRFATGRQRRLEFTQQILLLVSELDRRFHGDPAQEITRCAAAHGHHTLATQPEQFAGLRLGRNLELHAAAQRRYLELRTERCIDDRNRNLAEQILAVAHEDRMLAHRYLNVEIARRPTVQSGLAFTSEANAITGIDTGRHFHGQRLPPFHATAAAARTTRIADDLAGPATTRTGLLKREESLRNAQLSAATAIGTSARRRALSC